MHANFIDASEGAKAADVVAVMREIQRRVFEKRGIRLEPEIVPLGDWKREEASDVWWNLPPESFL
jgi:UDP-N-acetylmuramate dehydrogenase